MTEEYVRVKNIIFNYENGTRLVLADEQATKFAEWFFSDSKRTHEFDWQIENNKGIKGLGFFKRILSWSPWKT